MTSHTKKTNKRHEARAYAVQALYQWQFAAQASQTLIEEFFIDHPMKPDVMDKAYFYTLVSGTLEHVTTIDALLVPYLDRSITLLNPVELAILRLGVFELAHQKEVPDAVVINEAIELAKEYGAEDGFKYVNGVLNNMLPKLRKT